MSPTKKPNPLQPSEGEVTIKEVATTEVETFEEEVRSASSLADMAGTGGGSFEGDLVKLEGIEDEEVHILDYKVMPSQFANAETGPKNYVCFQARTLEGKLVVCNTSTGVPVQAFEAVDRENLPFCVVFFRQKSKAGNLYWNLKNPETPCLM